jgi:hypothetical protein
VADDQPHRPAGEAGVGHQRDGDAATAAQRGDPRRRIEQLGHARRAARTLVPDHHHVAVLEPLRRGRQRLDQCRLTVEDAGSSGEPAVVHAALDSGQLDDRAAVRSEVAAEQPQAAGRLERRRQRVDHLAVRRGRGQPGDLSGERLARAGDAVAIEQPGAEQLGDDHRQAALGVDVDHRITAERAGVHQHRKRA